MNVEDRRAYEICTVRDDYRCVRCGKPGTERDHRKNRSQGGLNRASNLQLLCHLCHVWKTSQPRLALETGFSVPGWAAPWDWPAQRLVLTVRGWQLTWCLYGDDGNVIFIDEKEAKRIMVGGES